MDDLAEREVVVYGYTDVELYGYLPVIIASGPMLNASASEMGSQIISICQQ